MGSIKLGNTSVNSVYLGNTEVKKVYLGSTLVWQKGSGPTPTTYGYTWSFMFRNQTQGSTPAAMVGEQGDVILRDSNGNEVARSSATIPDSGFETTGSMIFVSSTLYTTLYASYTWDDKRTLFENTTITFSESGGSYSGSPGIINFTIS